MLSNCIIIKKIEIIMVKERKNLIKLVRKYSNVSKLISITKNCPIR